MIQLNITKQHTQEYSPCIIALPCLICFKKQPKKATIQKGKQ